MSYFENIVGIGNLEIDYVIFEANYPVLFTCVDKDKQLYLCVCCDVRQEQRWIISRTTNENIIGLLTNKVTLRDAFRNQSDENYIVTWKYGTQKEKSKKVRFNQIDPLDLPTENEFLEAEDGEFKEYIDRLQHEEQKKYYRLIDINSQSKSKIVINFPNINKRFKYYSEDRFLIESKMYNIELNNDVIRNNLIYSQLKQPNINIDLYDNCDYKDKSYYYKDYISDKKTISVAY